MSEFHVGLDLGQVRDFSAIAVVERTEEATGRRDLVTYEPEREVRLRLRYLRRVKLGTPYPELVEQVRELVMGRALAGRCTLVVDATGLGGPVVDLLRAANLGCRLVPVTITGGAVAAVSGGWWRVPKRELLTKLQVLLQEERLAIAARLPEAPALVRELMGMQVRMKDGGRESYGASGRESAHDDLVMAVALACWKAGEKRWDLWGKGRIL